MIIGQVALKYGKENGITFVEIVILTAIGVGASTVIGALLGFISGGLSKRTGDVVLSFGAGVMLSAAVLGLILPSLELGGEPALIVTPLGVLVGGGVINLLERLMPRLEGVLMGERAPNPDERQRRRKVLLFVLAIAIHNIPEGIASGVAFGTGDVGDALMVSASIALQNIPEGMVLISPMLSVGISKKRALLYASLTGLIEVVSALLGYLTVSISSSLMPFFLSLAGGCMLYVITDEMIPETHSDKGHQAATFALIVGFLLMVVFGILV